MQQYNKIQKFISFFLIFFILFSFTFHGNFFGSIGTIKASNNDYHNIVSIFVQKEIYNSITNEIDTYAKNIQKTLENTKVIIIPTPKDTHPFNIASVNEKLYFEGEEGTNSKLIGSVFVGDLALPVVENNGSFEKTLFPYVDFEDKLYIYDHTKKRYILNTDSVKDPKAEIWHGFISPHAGNDDIQQIKDYFSKNNNYYLGTGKFQNSNGITNGKQENLIATYEPAVFYYDQIRESKAVKYIDYKAYEGYLSNKEDIVYNRFSQELSNTLKGNYFGNQKQFIGDLSEVILDSTGLTNAFGTPDTNNIPDIQNRHIIQNATKKFIQIFNESSLGELRKDVHNAGRYNSGSSDVNVDFIPYLITNLDVLSDSIVKNVNNELEKQIDDLVVNKGLSKNIQIFDNYTIQYPYRDNKEKVYTNFYYGMQAKNVTQANQCSIYRGSSFNDGQIVESNRGFNINNVNPDVATCNNATTSGYWGGNSPLNLNMSNPNVIWQLNSNDPNTAVAPLFDILGSLKTSNNILKYEDCFPNKTIVSKDSTNGGITYSVPINGNPAGGGWDCSSINEKKDYTQYTYNYVYNNIPFKMNPCEENYVYLDGQLVKNENYYCEGFTSFNYSSHHYNSIDYNCGSSRTRSNGDYCGSGIDGYSYDTDSVDTNGNTIYVTHSQGAQTNIFGYELIKRKYFFKTIPSYIMHKSPTADELQKQTKYMITPNLPIDKDRYVDFMGPNGDYKKINYPYLFRLNFNNMNSFDLETMKNELKNFLQPTTNTINGIKSNSIDLYQVLVNKPDKEIEILGEKKTLSYIDSLIFSLYWNKLNSVGAKYKFVMENYLSDQFGGNSFHFFLPKNKKQYEIAYLGSYGDAKNMYIKLDPEEKGENPYADIIANNLKLQNDLLGMKGINKNSLGKNSDGNFKCAPPEGVPIWQWIPAVMCRLGDILPPKISITDGNCGSSLISYTDENGSIVENIDFDKDGVNDILKKEIDGGKFELKTDSTKYYYNKTGKLEANVLNSQGKNILFDNNSKIRFELLKLEIPIDDTKEFTGSNINPIYDSTTYLKTKENYNEALKYISFKDVVIDSRNGKANYSFTTKSSEANVTFGINLSLYNNKGINVIVGKTDQKTIQIRGDVFYGNSYKLSEYNGELTLDAGIQTVVASNKENIYIIDGNSGSLNGDLLALPTLQHLQSLSPSKEKIFLSLFNNNKNGKNIPVAYPITVNIKDEKDQLSGTKTILSANNPITLGDFKKSGSYTFEIIDNFGNNFQKEIEVLPDDAINIIPSISTTLIEKGGVITTHAFSILDQFQNPTIGENYQVKVGISGNSLTFEDGKEESTFQVMEGYKPFRLKSTSPGDSTIQFTLQKKDNSSVVKSETLSVVDKIDFIVSGLPSDMKVGNNIYNYTLNIQSPPSGKKLNSRAYLISNNLYLQSDQEYRDIKNNTATGSFHTKTKAGENVKLEFKIEGVAQSVYKTIHISPDLPIKIDLSLSKGKIQADPSVSSELSVELKDRYNNVVWNDDATDLHLEILDKYKHIISSSQPNKQVQKGKATFTLTATNTPGTAFFSVMSNPSLSNNKIEIVGQSPFEKSKLDSIFGMRVGGILTDTGKKFFEEYDLSNYRFKFYDRNILQSNSDFRLLSSTQQVQILNLYDTNNTITIKGQGFNAGKIETFYFWNKQAISSKKYNALYTTLLGSNYGDITQKDNLANSILFDPNNRALAITSLLNNTENNIETVQIEPNGKISLKTNGNDLSQDISTDVFTEDNRLVLSFFNNTFEKLVSKIYVNLKKNTGVKLDFNTSVGNINKDDILKIETNGNITKGLFTQLELDSNTEGGLSLNIKYNGKIVGKMIITFPNTSPIKFIRDIAIDLGSALSSQTDGGMIVYLEGRDYYYTEKYLGASTKENIGYTISYNDPFASDTKTLNNFSNNFSKGYESFSTDQGIGWGEENKTLLSFSAGKSVGESTKDYMTFSLINIGDPVISLKQIKKKLPGTPQDRKFDATIGYLISKDEDNIAYNIFDYNKDDKTDIVILKRTGYIELLEGTGDIKNFISRGNIAYFSDAGTKPVIETGDFTGDEYDDIVLLNKNRQPILLDNNGKDFTRINLNLGLGGIISRIISYDMDLDTKYDLVTLDDSGEIYIHYGTATAGSFTKSKIDGGLGVNLNTTPRNDGGALYFDGLYQIPEKKPNDYITQSEQLLSQQNNDSLPQNEFNEGFVDKLLFTQMNYGGYITYGDNKDDMLNNLPDLSTLSHGGINIDTSSISNFVKTDLEQLNPGKNEYSPLYKNKISTFIKSEYALNEGVNIEKTYIDENEGSLKGGDKVKLTIKITNNSGKDLSSVAYVDKLNGLFKISENPNFTLNIGGVEIESKDIMIKSSPSDDFTFLLDSYKKDDKEKSISLQNGQSLYLTMILDTGVFEYGYIEAGLFDTTTNHGDIIFKPKNENCGKEYTLYKSTASRNLAKTTTAGVCTNDLPDFIKDNALDADGNGVPDYIDNLISSGGDPTYAKDKLDLFNKDTDGDGLVDREELSPFMNNGDDFMNSLDNIDQNIEKIMEGMDTILAGLSCGFGGPGCINTPINRAPLAPGQDLTLFGMTIGDGLNIGEGMPIFSAINWMKVGKFCIPMPWPPGSNLPGCIGSGAGGRIGPRGGSNSSTNFVRLFVTPTLTGSFGMAVCLGGPAKVAGMTNPKGFHPLVPGGNCIVAATPVGCKNDGSEGEIYNKGNPNATVINGGAGGSNGSSSCGDENKGKTPYLEPALAKEYLNYKKTGSSSDTLKNGLKTTFSTVAKPGGKWTLPSQPLLNISGSGDSFDMDVDFGALKSGNFEDIIKVKMPRISPFPDFIMEWVTRQIEEIANKLTDFPTLYVILPDLSGVMDSGWGDFMGGIQSQFTKEEQKSQIEKTSIQTEINKKQTDLKSKDCGKDPMGCYLDTAETVKLQAKKNIGSNTTVSGVKAAYDFMSRLPMINIETQKVNFNLPWIDKKTVDKAIRDFEITKTQWTNELERAKTDWNIDQYNCASNVSTTECKVMIDTQKLISSIDKNIAILNEYKKFPEKINKMIKIKEVRINQILCNIETITKITGGRIGDNGKRFKAWVELYVLIKAILKSWQLLVDVFIDFNAECHQCKNERRDTMFSLWKIIKGVIPKIPVIQFPKWPDIYLDLHNIRVQLNIAVPEYEFNLRPILLPTLPRLYLPKSPKVNINLPSLPLLPEITLPELPELPTLPEVQLPNLPPPPKLPKLFSSIEGVIKILKLITKAMCILKTSPFVPEWRAGDQIAFISERGGYLNIDFLDVSLPQFSFPFIDAIKVTTFVNLEMDVEFLVEMSRQMALPINSFTNDIANMINIGIGDLDFRNVVPFDEINVSPGGETGYNIQKNDKKVSLFQFAHLLALNIIKGYTNIKKDEKTPLTNDEFKNSISRQLPNIGNEKIVGVWKDALNYSGNKEDVFIQELLKNNESKFNEVRSILFEEKQKNNTIFSELEKQLSAPPRDATLINSFHTGKNYNTRLEKYNNTAVKSLQNIFVGDQETSEIKTQAKNIVNQVKTGVQDFSTTLYKSKEAFENVKVNSNKVPENNILAYNTPTKLLATTGTPTAGGTPSASAGSCTNSSGGYSFVYKGIYVIEEFGKKISYLLFDSIDELTGKEVTHESDFDSDTDQDMIYMVKNEIYIKENLHQKPTKTHYSGNPSVLDITDNKMYQNNFIESVNGLKESIIDNEYINIKFLDSTNPNIGNYRFEFYEIVDKFDDVMNGLKNTYIPTNIQKYIIDGFRDIDDRTIDTVNSSTDFTVRKNLAYIESIGNNTNGVTMKAKEINILTPTNVENTEVIIHSATPIYSAGESIQLTYHFYQDKDKEYIPKTATIPKYSNIDFSEDIILTGLTTNAYIEGNNYRDIGDIQTINEYIDKPIFPGTTIEYVNSSIPPTALSNIIIHYYDNSKTEILFENTKYYQLYDLGNKSSEYLVRTSMENNFYYLKAQSFKNNIFSTLSNQVILSPQREADIKGPELLNFSAVKLPVYQKREVDMSPYIFEDSGIKNIKDIFIDFDLNTDSNNNGDPYDDRDYQLGKTSTGIEIIKGTDGKIKIHLGIFDKLYDQKMRVHLEDNNGNVGYKDVGFIVYSPIPDISQASETNISGKLDEVLGNEPTSFYRIRGGSIDIIKDQNNDHTTNTLETGIFDFNLGNTQTASGLEVKNSAGTKLFTIDEYTGKININTIDKITLKLSYKVNPSDPPKNVYPKIIITQDAKEIYYQYISTPNVGKVDVVNTFDNINKMGIYYKPILSDYNAYNIPLGVPINPGALVIYPSNNSTTPVFTIFKDGRINAESDYILEYEEDGEYVIYNLKKVGETEIIGKVMIIPEKNFIIK